MPMLSGSYDVAMRLLRWASPSFARGSSKLARGLRGRADAPGVLDQWARSNREASRPLVWMHAPSVGEGLQAKVILEALVRAHPTLQSVYTFFSPSASTLAERFPADAFAYLPWDIHSELRALLSRLTPGLVSFTKTEVWPSLTRAASESGVPVILSAATLSKGAGRLRPGARQFLRPTFAALSSVLAIAEEDAERFVELGVSRDRIEVTGDPGIDSAWRRAQEADPSASYLAPFLADSRPTLVAGSTWPSDEALLVPVLRELADRFPRLRSIVAPHEPNPPHLDRLEHMIGTTGLRTARLAEIESGGPEGGVDVVLVDRVGVLAHLYTVSSFAYVGGGFHRPGLHSVLEPAAAGVPVLFGPRHRGARAAADLMRLGGGRQVASGPDLARALRSLLEDEEGRIEIGTTARGYIEMHRGAAERTARAMAGYFPAEALETESKRDGS